MNDFERQVAGGGGVGLHSLRIETLQINLGLRCNQECSHCHLEASPRRTEAMDWSTMEMVREAARSTRFRMVDLTGGAPELNPHFRRFVTALRKEGLSVRVEKISEPSARIIQSRDAGRFDVQAPDQRRMGWRPL